MSRNRPSHDQKFPDIPTPKEEIGFSDFQADRATVGNPTGSDVDKVADVAGCRGMSRRSRDVAEPTEPRSEIPPTRMWTRSRMSRDVAEVAGCRGGRGMSRNRLSHGRKSHRLGCDCRAACRLEVIPELPPWRLWSKILTQTFIPLASKNQVYSKSSQQN